MGRCGPGLRETWRAYVARVAPGTGGVVSAHACEVLSPAAVVLLLRGGDELLPVLDLAGSPDSPVGLPGGGER